MIQESIAGRDGLVEALSEACLPGEERGEEVGVFRLRRSRALVPNVWHQRRA